MTTALPHYDLRDPAPLTMSREELTAIQDERLGTMVAYVYETSPFWRRKLDGAGVRPGDVAGVEDLPRLPFCTRAELDADQAEHPPFGGYACSPRETWMGLFTTSGTSGRKLKRVVSERDWRLMIDRFYRHPAPPAGEIFMLLGPIDGLLGPAVGVEAARERGQIPLLAGLWDTRIKVEAIAELRPGTIAGAASYIVHLADVAREMGVDLAACGVRTVTSFGEPGVAIGATHATISSRYGVSELIDGYGLTEVWPLGGNCPASGALHIADDIAAVECVDPDTGSSSRRARPARSFIRRQEELSPEYRIVLDTGPRGLPVVTIQVEALGPSGGDAPALHDRVQTALRGGLGVNPEVEVLAEGSLPRAQQSKAKRVLDRRTGSVQTPQPDSQP